MSNGARHAWGILLGPVLTAALVALLVYGVNRLHLFGLPPVAGGGDKNDKWIGAALLAAAAVVAGLLTASRLSPVGSLVGGVPLTAFGVLVFISKHTTTELINKLPRGERMPLAALEGDGLILMVGVGLLIAAVFPSRWRDRRRAVAARPRYDESDPAASYFIHSQEPSPPPFAGSRLPFYDESGTR